MPGLVTRKEKRMAKVNAMMNHEDLRRKYSNFATQDELNQSTKSRHSHLKEDIDDNHEAKSHFINHLV